MGRINAGNHKRSLGACAVVLAACLILGMPTAGLAKDNKAASKISVAVLDLGDGSFSKTPLSPAFLKYATASLRKSLGKTFEVHDRDAEVAENEKNPGTKLKRIQLMVTGSVGVAQPRKKNADKYIEGKMDEVVDGVAKGAKGTKVVTVKKSEYDAANEGAPDVPGNVSLDLRVVDAETSEIVTAISGSARAKNMDPVVVPSDAKELEGKNFTKNSFGQMWSTALSSCAAQLDEASKDPGSRLGRYAAKDADTNEEP